MGASKGRRRHGGLVVEVKVGSLGDPRYAILEEPEGRRVEVCREYLEKVVGRKLRKTGKTYRVRLRGTVLKEL